MQKIVIASLLVVLFTLNVSSQDSLLAPPSRPSEFRTPEELRQYLKALNEYYAIVGRPRFGRSAVNRFTRTVIAKARADP